MSGVERRARVHLALGDPGRLAVVDRLALEDVSPGELAAQIGHPTNLMAHHLRVLEEAGLVRRVRSEGDRRRTYVQLRVDDPLVARLTEVGRHPPSTPPRVVFVCTANSARSQLAAAAWRGVSAVPVASAGTRPAVAVHPGALAAGRRQGLPIGRPRTALLDDVIRPGDLLVAVCDNAFEELPAASRDDRPDGPAVLHWAVPDPVPAATDAAFDRALDQLRPRIHRLARVFAADPAA